MNIEYEKIKLPNNIQFEKKLLGSLIHTARMGYGRDYEPIIATQEILDPQDFYDPKHTAIFIALCSLVKERKPIELVSIFEKVTGEKNANQQIIGQLIAELATCVVTSANWKYYATEVKKLSERRTFIRTCWEYSQAACKEESIDTLLGNFQQNLIQIKKNNTDQLVHVKEFMVDVLMNLSDELSKRSNGQESIPGIKTGLVDLDKKTGGLRPGNQVVIAARPGEGKTTLGEQICSHIAQQGNVIIFSYEMSKEELGERLLQSLSGLNLRKASSKEDATLLLRTGEQIERLNIYIDDSSPTIDQLEARVQRFAYEVDISAIMVDYLQLIPISAKKTRYEAITDHSFRLKTIAKRLKTVTLVLSQLSRDSEKRAGKGEDFDRPRLSDLRESGAIEQDADLIFFLHRKNRNNEHGELNNEVQLLCDKFRNGNPFELSLYFERDKSRFRCAAKNEYSWTDQYDGKMPF